MNNLEAHHAFTKRLVEAPLIAKAAAFGFLIEGAIDKSKPKKDRGELDWNQILSMFMHNFIVACNELGHLPTGTEFRTHKAFTFVRLVMIRLLGTLKDDGYEEPEVDTRFALGFLMEMKPELMKQIKKHGAGPCKGLHFDDLDLLF